MITETLYQIPGIGYISYDAMVAGEKRLFPHKQEKRTYYLWDLILHRCLIP